MEHQRRDRPIPEGPFDLAVVGGGINGVAIARDAVLRGRSVVLLERADLASGTSSASSKMLHGGIRYLEYLRLGLVYESLRERHLLLRLAAHLVHPQSFLVPLYEGSTRSRRLVQIGLWLYDKLSLGRRLGPSRMLSAAEVLERAPDLLPAGLAGGGLYWDTVMDDARLVVLNAVAAREEAQEGSVPFFLRTYTEVVGRTETSPLSIATHDRLTGRTQRILAHRLVYALGPWTEPEYLAPSKGVHLVMPRFPSADGLLLQHSRDGRVFFIIPWYGHTVVGTTETPFRGDPAEVRAGPEDVEYLLSELRRLFPKISFGPSDIRGIFAGVRPLARDTRPLPALLARLFRSGRANELSLVSRNHRIVDEGNGILKVFGGKYTTYRAVARQVVDRLFGGTCQTHRRPLPGAEEGGWDEFLPRLERDVLERHGKDEIRRLFGRYGCRLRRVLDLVRDDPTLGEPLVEGALERRAEVVHAIRHEFAEVPEDFLCRRTHLRFLADGGRAAYSAVEELLLRHATLSPPDLAARRERYFSERDLEDRLAGRHPAATTERTS